MWLWVLQSCCPILKGLLIKIYSSVDCCCRGSEMLRSRLIHPQLEDWKNAVKTNFSSVQNTISSRPPLVRHNQPCIALLCRRKRPCGFLHRFTGSSQGTPTPFLKHLKENGFTCSSLARTNARAVMRSSFLPWTTLWRINVLIILYIYLLSCKILISD